MIKVPTKPEDFYWKSGKGNLDQALQFLIDTRNYVAQLTLTEGYRQMAHSGDARKGTQNYSSLHTW